MSTHELPSSHPAQMHGQLEPRASEALIWRDEQYDMLTTPSSDILEAESQAETNRRRLLADVEEATRGYSGLFASLIPPREAEMVRGKNLLGKEKLKKPKTEPVVKKRFPTTRINGVELNPVVRAHYDRDTDNQLTKAEVILESQYDLQPSKATTLILGFNDQGIRAMHLLWSPQNQEALLGLTRGQTNALGKIAQQMKKWKPLYPHDKKYNLAINVPDLMELAYTSHYSRSGKVAISHLSAPYTYDAEENSFRLDAKFETRKAQYSDTKYFPSPKAIISETEFVDIISDVLALVPAAPAKL